MQRDLLEDRYGRQISALLILVVFLGMVAAVTLPAMERLGLTGLEMAGWLAAVAVVIVGLVNLPHLFAEMWARITKPLSYAVGAGRVRRVEWLLERGADPDKRGPFGSALLSVAARKGQADMVRILLEHGADVGPRDVFHKTPLIEASEAGFTEIVKLLIEAGADVEAEDEDGERPLGRAILHNNPEVVRLLLEAGVDTQRRNEQGESPLELAESMGTRRSQS